MRIKTLSNLIPKGKIVYDYNKVETFDNVLPLGLVPKTNNNVFEFEFKKEKLNDRTFLILNDIEIKLSDGHKIFIPAGYTTDLISIPKWLWSFLSPFDSLIIGDIIHDYLYSDKVNEITRYSDNIYQAQKFADEERNRWRTKIAEHITGKKKNKYSIKNWLTNKFLRLFAKDFYIRKYQIPS